MDGDRFTQPQAIALVFGMTGGFLTLLILVLLFIRHDRRSRLKAASRRRAADIEAARTATHTAVVGLAGRAGRACPRAGREMVQPQAVKPMAKANAKGLGKNGVDISTVDGSMMRKFHSAETGEVIHYGKGVEADVDVQLDEVFVVGDEAEMGFEVVELVEEEKKRDSAQSGGAEGEDEDKKKKSVEDEMSELEKAGKDKAGLELAESEREGGEEAK
ncbi:uncharacterized protein EI97DRAFT_485582 [Westerdykella ornata]|uniref:Uncharacterized protein n=1 Tax=Westerdykella ornata TaxID=318751 RepID=A0A6A6J8R0_WESOR|nr:uncharacterized protein EI97DRAFT_485582 [Westerdykella ornata]KAF2272026.1 hypothetical protein EI97DRAFT_485582 [Westerdykella ornata]